MATTYSELSSTTGIVCMWNGTKDGQEAYFNHEDRSTNMNYVKSVPITATDVRSLPYRPTLEEHGYQLVNFQTSLRDSCFVDHTLPENKHHIETVYYDECRRLALAATGATEAYPYVWRIRNQSKDIQDLKQSDFHNDSVPLVHVDRDPATAPDRLRASLGTERAEALMAKYGTIGSVNVWRPIKNKVQKWPLMLVDHSSVPDWHYDTYMGRIYFINDKRIGTRGAKSHENLLKFDKRYAYYYASNMTPDEAWLFYAYHSNPKLGIPHSAFWDNNTPYNAPTRWSIEVRIWVFFEGSEEGDNNKDVGQT